MNLILDLKINAFNSIYHGLVHLERVISDNSDNWSKDVKFDHDSQMTTYIRNEKFSFYVNELYYIPPKYYEFKFCVLHFIHGIELLLLEIVKAHNESDIYIKVGNNKTINFWKALDLAKQLSPNLLTDSQFESLKTCKELRNNLEHFEIKSNYSEMYKVTSQLISIINGIFQLHLNLNLVKFYEFDCWKDEFTGKFTFAINQCLQDLKKNGYEYNNYLIESKLDLMTCLYCGENSYSLSENLCFFCLTEFDEEIKNVL